MARVYVGIGSNVEPEKHVSLGLRQLRQKFGALTVSTIYANPAVGFRGNDFFNLVVGFDTSLAVFAVAATLRDIEAHFQARGNGTKQTSRALDLDLLLYNDLVLQQGTLHIPREEITRYAFVLRPLAEIAGERQHPLLGTTFAELWAAFDTSSAEKLTPVALVPEQYDSDDCRSR
ncbi:MAG: 2-amino-4-hydroxy-6-hydroxymethyldihydropteridine diphosphokinase [Candidatus Contendobacter odensis]|uniref:2-amino-4-hydroxy-6-hydroxymethyldihydropteridine diphosphokinase n=1 Tax=Candidatus Contendibacter odensensis TaxID=1400860 RepID=A0A2G6PHV4_9GAMM|nr:MAG: 2-amino-4-hydroxy-6-hydroxymethyldihydropteridine diphosphokinase [Candidatus Contendobacter odensis]